MHLQVEPEQVIEIVKTSKDDSEQNKRLLALFPDDLKVLKWNRELVQKGMSEMGREALESSKKKMLTKT